MQSFTRVVGFMAAWGMVMATALDRVPAEVVDRSILDAGEHLAAGDELASTSGRYTLTMGDDGNLVLRDGDEVTWASGTAVAGSALVVQPDGNMVVRAPGGAPVWSTGTAGAGPSSLQLHDDGRLVVEDATEEVRWAATAAPA